jgi:hypothetical protein
MNPTPQGLQVQILFASQGAMAKLENASEYL